MLKAIRIYCHDADLQMICGSTDCGYKNQQSALSALNPHIRIIYETLLYIS